MSNAINRDKLTSLPAIVRSFVYQNEGWIVGSGASFLLDVTENSPRDWDVIIPFWTWGRACRTIPDGSTTNDLGGAKIVSGELSVDVWAGDVGWFLSQVPSHPAYAVHPLSLTYMEADK